ncbi:hypothetical protein [Cellulomonas fimi]|uniref:Uncharacterized protein n=1 Tax=Cellulomonas fimi (strain ATCC 484 / DSM 20113 / JCM 1341 / CCUG 24087 / LMG 16345 / NBRC 15513 / NCIMB 8980 / NCTC 7547 / NRS-133) TaxID=590998 RepID=F4H588_CELFA|nr:hypothetical protein [Cellulomonas fimi]AEE46694.1 hypothetical protein Celf_2569 [Cellulomonas fimi ATCC 484]NNH07661.1 hypothetical protein [Cellulomonas fimi]VEH33906.1 Uncharacterised protein [Cellulomonas fimi]
MSATIYGLNGTSWNGSKGVFFWLLQSMAARTSSPSLAARLRELDSANLHWLDLEDFSRAEHDELIHLLHETPPIARREFAHRPDGKTYVEDQLDALLLLE